MKRFNLIYVDPPWQYRNKRTGGSMSSGADSKYITIPTRELLTTSIDPLCMDDCYLFMWVTSPMLYEGMELLRQWGFKYKTKLVWRKKQKRFGMGFYFRVETEDVLVGVRGKVKAPRIQERNWVDPPPTKHSRKPEEMRRLVELAAISSFGKRRVRPLEMFATHKEADGELSNWSFWGNEIESDINFDLVQPKPKVRFRLVA